MNSTIRIIVAGVVLIASAGAGYLVGIQDFVAINSLLSQLETQLAKQTTRIETLSQKLQVKEVEFQTTAAKSARLEADLQQMTEKSYALSEKLSMYQKVMSPEEIKSGVIIDSIFIQSLSDASRYRMTLVLLQVGRKKYTVSGTVSLRINGQKNGRSYTASNKVLVNDPDNHNKVKFRYLSEVETVFTLPEGLEPEELIVSFNFKRAGIKGKRKLEQSFDWKTSQQQPEYLN